MNEIVVLSGKGGTGKTSIAASLAVLAGVHAVIADCDVDAANMHILLDPDFGENSDFFSGMVAEIREDVCTACGLCAEKCRFHAITAIDGKYQISPLDCDGCGYCERICPTQAISLLERKSGKLFISQTRIGSAMVHASLYPGAENSGKLVARVKSEAKTLAKASHKAFIIVDGSPGIGCPVVSSLSGANYVILVTEPTISAIHDLKRAYSVIRRFRIKSGCIINKSDLNQEKTLEIKAYLSEMEIDHLADIPYDINFTRTMLEGKTMVEIQSPINTILKSTWEKVQEILTN